MENYSVSGKQGNYYEPQINEDGNEHKRGHNPSKAEFAGELLPDIHIQSNES